MKRLSFILFTLFLSLVLLMRIETGLDGGGYATITIEDSTTNREYKVTTTIPKRATINIQAAGRAVQIKNVDDTPFIRIDTVTGGPLPGNLSLHVSEVRN